MSRFPLFIDLAGRRAVVIGGGTVGLRRAAALRDFGAMVTVISPTLSGPLPDVTYLPRPYRAGDLAGAFLVVAATDDSAVNALLRRQGAQVDELVLGNTSLDLASATLCCHASRVRLSAKEFDIMRFLLPATCSSSPLV